MSDQRLDAIKSLIRDVPDFPKKGILFKDITPLLSNADGFRDSIDLIAESLAGVDFDVIAGPEARGFIFGCPLAVKLGKGFVPIRKKGKLPYTTVEESYALEYGEDTVQIHSDAVEKGQKVLLVDDLLATGGTMGACRRLIENQGATVVACSFVIELGFLNGREMLGETLRIESLINY
ncbi:MAG: adenine phosphoribosyltransferase [Planctomycetota bacterium]|jgi:adenine phosphoribosyltransferase